MKAIVLILSGATLCLISCSKNEEPVFLTQSEIAGGNNPLKTRQAIFEDSVEVAPLSFSIGSFQGNFSYENRSYRLQFDYSIDSQGQVLEAYAGAYGIHYYSYNNNHIAELYTLGSKPAFYNFWMELIIKCNYYEATQGNSGTLFYYVKKRLTLLAKYYPATNEYSCLVMKSEDGFWDPREDLFP